MTIINKIKKGVIHIGGHKGQEREYYKDFNVLWIEPIPDVFDLLVNNIKPYPSQTALNYLISDVDNKQFSFNVSNQSERSSFLQFTDFHFKDPNFQHTETLTLSSIRMDTLIKTHDINLNDYDVIVTDCQGADYFVLKSFGELINHFSYIKSEVMVSEIYKGLAKEEEVNNFLASCGFELISDLSYKVNKTQRDNIYKNKSS